jgi:hypothetical protein
MASSHFSLNESMEIIASRNFHHGSTTKQKDCAIVRPKKERFNVRFIIWVLFLLFLSFMCIISSAKELLSFALCSFLARSEKRFVMRRKKAIYSSILCHHKLLIVIMKERREETEMCL